MGSKLSGYIFIIAFIINAITSTGLKTKKPGKSKSSRTAERSFGSKHQDLEYINDCLNEEINKLKHLYNSIKVKSRNTNELSVLERDEMLLNDNVQDIEHKAKIMLTDAGLDTFSLHKHFIDEEVNSTRPYQDFSDLISAYDEKISTLHKMKLNVKEHFIEVKERVAIVEQSEQPRR